MDNFYASNANTQNQGSQSSQKSEELEIKQILESQQKILDNQQKNYRNIEVIANKDEFFGFQDAIDAVQAGSFAVIVVLGVIFWQVKGQVSKLLDRHIQILDTMKNAIKTNTALLESLTKSDDVIAASVVKLVESDEEIKEDLEVIQKNTEKTISALYQIQEVLPTPPADTRLKRKGII